MSLSPQPKNINKGLGYVLALGGELGFLIALPLVICIFLGVMIDKKLATSPMFIIIFIILGILLTIVDVYKIVIPFLEKRSSDNKK